MTTCHGTVSATGKITFVTVHVSTKRRNKQHIIQKYKKLRIFFLCWENIIPFKCVKFLFVRIQKSETANLALISFLTMQLCLFKIHIPQKEKRKQGILGMNELINSCLFLFCYTIIIIFLCNV